MQSIHKFITLAAAFFLSLCAGCGIYTFNGSSLPGHLKTVDIPLFANQTPIAGIAEAMTEQVSRQVVESNQLSVITGKGDATISGTVLYYANDPYTYGATGVRQVDISQYQVTIRVDVVFMDNKTGNSIYKGTLEGKGIYDFKTETEDKGRTLAIQDIVKQILQNSIQSW